VVALSLLPYFSRTVTDSLGRWVAIAPALALAISVLGGLLIHFEETRRPPALRQRRSGQVPSIHMALLAVLVTAVAANLWAVWQIWAAPGPVQGAAPEQVRGAPVLRTSALDQLGRSPSVLDFASAAGKRPLPSSPSLSVMTAYVSGILATAKCVADRQAGSQIRGFECTLGPSKQPEWPSCRFTWSLSPVTDPSGSTLVSAASRDEVVTKFPHSGFGKYGEDAGAGAPYIGVAFVNCGGTRVAALPPGGNLRVAFVLSAADDISTYHALFRTVGFDWTSADYFKKPYIAELFALASLYDVSRILYRDRALTTLTSTGHELFGQTQIEALRELSLTTLWIGNRSDGQLGNSRGSCLLLADASHLATSTARLIIAPSGVTPDLPTSDRSLILLPKKGGAASLPCTLVSALTTRNMNAARDYPASLQGEALDYLQQKEQSRQDAQRIGFNIRAAGLTLYLLGFRVSYDLGRHPNQVVGFWPRAEFITPNRSEASNR
jgi:hypothetical protein